MNETQTLPNPDARAEPRLGLGPLGIAVRVIVAIAILLISGFLVAGLLALLGAMLGIGDTQPELTLGVVVLFVLAQACMLGATVLALWAWFRFVERRSLRTAGWTWSTASAGWLLLAITVAAALVLAAVAVLPATGPVQTDEFRDAYSPIALGVVVILSQTFLLQAIPEELLFRGWLLTTMRARPVLAITVTTLSFTAIHLISNGGQTSFTEHLLYLAMPFGFSLLAVGMQLWTGSLWAAVGVHGGFHLGNAAAGLLLPQVNPVHSWLVIGAFHALVGIALIVTALGRGSGTSGRRAIPGEGPLALRADAGRS